MKISKDTIKILKSLAEINSGVQFKPDEPLMVFNPEDSVLAKAELPESFPKEFAIYDLHKFLAVLDLFDSPDVKLGDKKLEIREGNSKVSYVYADPSTIVPSYKKVKMPEVAVSFNVTEPNMQAIAKAAATLQLPALTFVGDSDKVKVCITDINNDASNSFSIDLEEATDRNFTLVFNISRIVLFPGGYKIELGFSESGKGISHWTHENGKVEYYIPPEDSSKIEKSGK